MKVHCQGDGLSALRLATWGCVSALGSGSDLQAPGDGRGGLPWHESDSSVAGDLRCPKLQLENASVAVESIMFNNPESAGSPGRVNCSVCSWEGLRLKRTHSQLQPELALEAQLSVANPPRRLLSCPSHIQPGPMASSANVARKAPPAP